MAQQSSTEDKVIIFDTTLRDGEQSAGAGLTVEEKLRIAHQLNKLGVDVIEAGFAGSSAGDFEAVRRIANEVKGPIITSLARAVDVDIDAAGRALEGVDNARIHVFISASDIHLMHQMRKNREVVMDMAVNGVERAKRFVDDVEFSAMDASRTEPEYLYTMLEAVIKAGATTVNIPDTVGYSTPDEFGALIRGIRENVPNIDQAVISVHCHNDLGMSSANSLAAIENGARQVEGCINGLGERAGNAAIEEVIMAIETRPDHYGLNTGITTEEIGNTSRMVSSIFGFPVQANKAIVGQNAFR
ncbi:MAG TPA: 2-isopropylmalate synthase, partial [Dehalococcoidia bacterium]|nr:2-isopropylmalate synthase [Dehalococcoidia bacterium]